MKQSTSCHCQWLITLCYLHVAQQEKHLRISTDLPKVGPLGTLIPQASHSFAKLFDSTTLLRATFTASPQWRFVLIFPRLATEPSPRCLSTQLLQSLLCNFSTTLSSTILSYNLYQPLHARHPIPGTLLQHLDFWTTLPSAPKTGLNPIEYWIKYAPRCSLKCSSPHHQLPLILYSHWPT